MQLVNRNKSSPHLMMYESVVLNPYSYIPKWVYLKRQQIYFGSTTKDWVHSKVAPLFEDLMRESPL